MTPWTDRARKHPEPPEPGEHRTSRMTPRERRGILISGILVAVGSVALAGASWWSSPAPRPAAGTINLTTAPPDVGGLATGLSRWPVAERVPAPTLSGRTLSGSRLTTRQFRGRVLVINAWGSWCPPCRAEAPDLRRAALETRDLGVQFLGIDTRDNAASARAFVREFRIPYPSIVDEKGSVLLALRDTVPARAIPSTVVLDREGRIAARVVGRVRYPTLRGLIDDVVNEAQLQGSR